MSVAPSAPETPLGHCGAAEPRWGTTVRVEPSLEQARALAAAATT